MDISSLSAPDLSLFCGDLLPTNVTTVGSSVITDENLQSLLLDGINLGTDTSWSTKAPFDNIMELDAHDSGLGKELFGASWLDTKVDLLDFLEDAENVEPVASPLMSPGPVTEVPDSSFDALQTLQGVVEATTQMLAEEKCPVSELEDEPSPTQIPGATSFGLMDLLTTVDSSVLEPELDFDLLKKPILSPVTAEDVVSVLSSGPSSPEPCNTSSEQVEMAMSLLHQIEQESVVEVSVFDESLLRTESLLSVSQKASPATIEVEHDAQLPESREFDDEQIPSSTGKFPASRQRQTPYTKSSGAKPLDRRQRKKQQNKDAATRYRQKKKAEQDAISAEFDSLMERNTELKEQVDQMTKEIQYLKNLMADVYRAKGILLPKSK
jgi:cyclic AMP-dependent transcription factor ATF-4